MLDCLAQIVTHLRTRSSLKPAKWFCFAKKMQSRFHAMACRALHSPVSSFEFTSCHLPSWCSHTDLYFVLETHGTLHYFRDLALISSARSLLPQVFAWLSPSHDSGLSWNVTSAEGNLPGPPELKVTLVFPPPSLMSHSSIHTSTHLPTYLPTYLPVYLAVIYSYLTFIYIFIVCIFPSTL